jgi:hypothetical protein
MFSKLEVLPENKMEEAVEEVHHTERSTAIYWQNHLKSAIVANKSILSRRVCSLCSDNYGELCSDYRHVTKIYHTQE